VRADPVLKELPLDEALGALRHRRDAIAQTVSRLPPHGAYLQQVLGS
jgi:tryptophan halogenase